MSPIRTGLAAIAIATTILSGTTLPAQARSAPQTAPARHCTNADLTASYAHARGGDAAGSVYGWIRLTNTSHHRCWTKGFGGVSYTRDGGHRIIGQPAERTDRSAARRILLKPGQAVRSSIQQVRAQNYDASTCKPVHVTGFRVYAPDTRRWQFVRHATTGCRNSAVHLLIQRPYQRA